MGDPARWMAAFILCGIAAVAGLPSAAADAWIGWCAEPHAEEVPGNGSQMMFQPHGARRWLTLGDGAVARTCRGRSLPVERDHVVWFGPLPAMSEAFERGMNLQGRPGGPSGFQVSGAEPVNGGEPEPRTDPADTVAAPAPDTARPAGATVTAAWMWRPAAWRHGAAEIFRHLARHDARLVYVTIPMDEGEVEMPEALGEFIALAGARGVAVWAVMGDPHAVLPSQRGRFAQWARGYAAYNAHSPPQRRLAGVQLDIEPYLLPGYGQDAEAWDAAYVETVNAVARAAPDLAVEVAVPVWFGFPLRRGRILDHLAAEIGSVAVMDYRTDEERIVQDALPFLAWGAHSGRGVRVAVELGPLPDEETRFYRSTDGRSGQLWRVPLEGGDALILLDRPARNPVGPSLALVGTAPAPGAAQSFHGTGEERIPPLLRALETRLAPWSSFLGVAIHGME